MIPFRFQRFLLVSKLKPVRADRTVAVVLLKIYCTVLFRRPIACEKPLWKGCLARYWPALRGSGTSWAFALSDRIGFHSPECC